MSTSGAAGKGKERAEQRAWSNERRETNFQGKDGERFLFLLWGFSPRVFGVEKESQRTDHPSHPLSLPPSPPYSDQAISTSGRPKNSNLSVHPPLSQSSYYPAHNLTTSSFCLYQPVLPDKALRKTPEELEKDDPYTMYLSRPERELKPWYTDPEMRRVEDRGGRDRVADRKRERRMYVLCPHLPPSSHLSLLSPLMRP